MQSDGSSFFTLLLYQATAQFTCAEMHAIDEKWPHLIFKWDAHNHPEHFSSHSHIGVGHFVNVPAALPVRLVATISLDLCRGKCLIYGCNDNHLSHRLDGSFIILYLYEVVKELFVYNQTLILSL